jgi:hypothetical protein
MVLEQVFENHQHLNSCTKLKENLLERRAYQDFRAGITLSEPVGFDPRNDLAVFIFLLIFYESKEMRNDLRRSTYSSR